VTPNQIVAYNLRRARGELTLQQALDRLRAAGIEWSSVQTLHKAERAAEEPAGRRFTMEDLVAMARAFDLPVVWFLLPPSGDEGIELDGSDGLVAGQLVEFLLFDRHDAVEQRVESGELIGHRAGERIQQIADAALYRALNRMMRDHPEHLSRLVRHGHEFLSIVQGLFFVVHGDVNRELSDLVSDREEGESDG
jgi:transcriptional regulator with XRE-family HTH domain